MVNDCPCCGAPAGMIGWLCNCKAGCKGECKELIPQWMKDDYEKKNSGVRLTNK